VEEDLRGLLALEPLPPRVERLRCFPGIDDLTALTIAAERGDPYLFALALRAIALVGLVPSEHSSGTPQGRDAITNPAMPMCAACSSKPSGIIGIGRVSGAALRPRRRNAPAALGAHAWTADC